MILDEILARTRETVAARKRESPAAALESLAQEASAVRGFAAALRRPGRVTCIAEIKRRSPSAGWIRQGADAALVAALYQAAGAAAVSVLTDGPFFGGSLADLARVRARIELPLLRKDFVVDPYQVVEARAAGADAILVILAAVEDALAADLMEAAAGWGLDVLVETHGAEEVERAVGLGARVIGINHRDLRTLEVDVDLATRLRPSVPQEIVVVAESGIRAAADLTRLAAGRIDAVLVGETLMRAADPGAALREILT